jgi:hypothetical protein
MTWSISSMVEGERLKKRLAYIDRRSLAERVIQTSVVEVRMVE